MRTENSKFKTGDRVTYFRPGSALHGFSGTIIRMWKPHPECAFRHVIRLDDVAGEYTVLENSLTHEKVDLALRVLARLMGEEPEK